MKLLYKKIVATIGIVIVCATTAEATPAFARQMSTDCTACHYQNIPKLNSFGRDFKLSGFTMIGGGQEITGEANNGLALPSNLNMAFVIKARYHDVGNKSGTSGNAKKSLEIFDESAFLFGGKISENIGTSMEFIEGLAGGKITYSKPNDFGRIGFTVFMTDGLGVFSGTEVYTTGLYRAVRQFENRKKANIFQKLGIGQGAAQGVQVYYSGNGLTATVGQYVPVYGASTETTEGGYKTFARASYELHIKGFNVAVGGYYIGGDVKDNAVIIGDKIKKIDANSFDRESTGLDLQIEGNVADNISLMVTGGMIISNEYTAGGIIGIDKDSDTKGFSIAAQLNPIESWGAKVAYLSSSDNNDADKDESIISVGTDYNLNQNVRLCLEYSNTSFGNSALTNQSDILFMTHLAF